MRRSARRPPDRRAWHPCADPAPGHRPAPELARYDQIQAERAAVPAPATSPAQTGEALAVLSAVVDRDGQFASATQDRHRALASADHLAILNAIWTAETAQAREQRYQDLLAASLPPGYRRQPGHQAKWLWRTTRGAELAGLDAGALLAAAVAERDLAGARDTAAVLDARLRHRLGALVPQPPGPWSAQVPALADPERRAYLAEIAAMMDARAAGPAQRGHHHHAERKRELAASYQALQQAYRQREDVFAAVMADRADWVDAATLAQLLRADLLPEAWIAPAEVRQLRALLRHRAGLVRLGTQQRNRIHAVVADFGYDRSGSYLSGPGRGWLAGLDLPATSREIVADCLAVIDGLASVIDRIDSELRLHAKADPRVKTLTTLPGVGQYTALVMVAEIGDISRFPSARKLASWAGLTPTVRGSDRTVRHGHISKQGSAWLRWVLNQAAQTAKRSPEFAATYAAIAKRRGKKIATIAIARKLLTRAWHLLAEMQATDASTPLRRP